MCLYPTLVTFLPHSSSTLVCLSFYPGVSVASPPGPLAPECGPAVGSVLLVSGPAAALRLEQTLHPRVHHTHLLPHILPTPHHCCRWGGHQDMFVHSPWFILVTCHDCIETPNFCAISTLVKLFVLAPSCCESWWPASASREEKDKGRERRWRRSNGLCTCWP